MADSSSICGRVAAERLRSRRKLRHSFVRTLRGFAPQNACSGAKSRGFRTRCNQWTQTQRIRTAAAIPVAVPMFDAGSIPV